MFRTKGAMRREAGQLAKKIRNRMAVDCEGGWIRVRNSVFM